MKNPILVMIAAAIIISGCQQAAVPGEPQVCTMEVRECADGSFVGRDPQNNCEFNQCPAAEACTADAKLCPDGSAVGRDPNNNCEFRECPTSFGLHIDRKYVERDPETCKLVDFICIEGARPFFDDTGCGCEPIEPVRYIANSTDECSRIRYACNANELPFSDETGCGCMFSWGNETPENMVPKTFCDSERSGNDIMCNTQYDPVCGYLDSSIPCSGPCSQTFSNGCEACANPQIQYYTAGECN